MIKAYQDPHFLESRDARALRILAEYLEPLSRFQRHRVQDTVVFMGSARLSSRRPKRRCRSRKQGGSRMPARLSRCRPITRRRANSQVA